MPNASQQSGVKVTGSFENTYTQSLIKLTLLYVSILAVILFISGVVSYTAFSKRIGHRFERPPVAVIFNYRLIVPPFQQAPTAEEVREDFIASLILVNSLLLLLAGIFSYKLAQITLRPIKKSYEQQRQFLANASHELRTPLSILQIELENELSDSAIPNKTKDRVKSNLEEVHRMSKLVADLLLLSRLDTRNIPVKTRSPILLSEILKETTDRLKPLAQAHGVSLLLQNHVDQKYTIETDKELLSQAITNVIKNGIIYNTPKGKVEIITHKGEKKLSIIVIDTGIGMKKEDVKRIFERFYRVDASRSRQTGGSGLGLSIVNSAVEHLGGTVEIESEEGKGTTVTIEFPSL